MVSTPEQATDATSEAARFEAAGRKLLHAIELEQAQIRFEPIALGILGAIYDRGQMSCEELAARIETPEEWIWFSRLQRARLVQDVGSAFSLSSDGYTLVERLLSEDAAS